MKIEKFGVLKLNIPRGWDLGGSLWKLIFLGSFSGIFLRWDLKNFSLQSPKRQTRNLDLGGGFKHFFYLTPYLGR